MTTTPKAGSSSTEYDLSTLPSAGRRRLLGQAGKGALVLAAGVSVGGRAFAQSLQPESSSYIQLDSPIATRDPSRVEVLEFFWFGCPHCYRFEPTINEWAATRPDYVDFVREAPPLNASWEVHSRAFYAAEALGITDKFFDPMFESIHAQRKPMRRPGDIAELAESLDAGTSEDEFEKTMSSFTVETSLKRSVALARNAGITGVPSMLINGRYVTSSSLAGSNTAVIDVINELVEQEHAAL